MNFFNKNNILIILLIILVIYILCKCSNTIENFNPFKKAFKFAKRAASKTGIKSVTRGLKGLANKAAEATGVDGIVDRVGDFVKDGANLVEDTATAGLNYAADNTGLGGVVDTISDLENKVTSGINSAIDIGASGVNYARRGVQSGFNSAATNMNRGGSNGSLGRALGRSFNRVAAVYQYQQNLEKIKDLQTNGPTEEDLLSIDTDEEFIIYYIDFLIQTMDLNPNQNKYIDYVRANDDLNNVFGVTNNINKIREAGKNHWIRNGRNEYKIGQLGFGPATINGYREGLIDKKDNFLTSLFSRSGLDKALSLKNGCSTKLVNPSEEEMEYLLEEINSDDDKDKFMCYVLRNKDLISYYDRVVNNEKKNNRRPFLTDQNDRYKDIQKWGGGHWINNGSKEWKNSKLKDGAREPPICGNINYKQMLEN